MSRRIRLPTLGAPVDELWEVLFDLADQLDVPWTLVGGRLSWRRIGAIIATSAQAAQRRYGSELESA